MTLYLNNRFYSEFSDVFSANGLAWAVQHLPGVYRTYAGAKWLGCSYEPNAWINYLATRCGEIMDGTTVSGTYRGLDGLYIDEWAVMQECYNGNHVHYQQDGISYSVDRLAQGLTQVRDAIRGGTYPNPEAIMMTEHAGSDYFTQFIDGSWDQTFYSAFSLNEQYYDEYSINYFRFCFPEFHILFWGPSPNEQLWERRALFSGVGICQSPLTPFQKRAGQLMEENSDAFASLSPEPIIPTNYSKVLANKFPVAAKTIYTVYNKSTTNYYDTAIMEVEHRAGFHYVELFEDENYLTVNNLGLTDELVFSIPFGQVRCIAQMPEIIQTSVNPSTVDITLSQYDGSEILVVFINYDNSYEGFGDGEIISLTNGQGQAQIPGGIGSGTLIFKLYRDWLLLDEVVLGGIYSPL